MNLAPLAGLLSPLGVSRPPAVTAFAPDQLSSLRLWLAGLFGPDGAIQTSSRHRPRR